MAAFALVKALGASDIIQYSAEPGEPRHRRGLQVCRSPQYHSRRGTQQGRGADQGLRVDGRQAHTLEASLLATSALG